MRKFCGLGRSIPFLSLSGTQRRWSIPPPRSATDAEVQQIANTLVANPKLLFRVVEMMSPESRRRLVVAGGAYEFFGKEAMTPELERADVGKDYVICPKDFDRWFEGALKRKIAQAEAKAESGTTKISTTTGSVPFFALALIALEAGLPFVGFGFLDNFTMILAGDAIDKTLGAWLHCSVMASAAMGNVVSGVMGMQVHGFIERLVQILNLPVPVLSHEQRQSNQVFLAGHLGGTLGVACGLLLGMVPLLFISGHDDEKQLRAIFNSIDTAGDGSISSQELKAALNSAGVKVTEEKVAEIIQSVSGGAKKLEFEHFQSLVKEIKRNS